MNVEQLAKKAKQVSFELATLSTEIKNQALQAVAQALQTKRAEIFQANRLDLEQAKEALQQGLLKQSVYDRLILTEDKLNTAIQGIKDMVLLPDPIGRTLLATQLDEGLELYKVSCPIGLIGVIFEARPDVVMQIAALMIKSANAAILKGGKETLHTNQALMQIIQQALLTVPHYPQDSLALVHTREDAAAMLALPQYFDLIIPRGGNTLIRYVQTHTQIPVLGHADGVCHIYVARSATVEMAQRICVDAKTQYPAACNSMETLLVDCNWPLVYQKQLLKTLSEQGIILYGDEAIASLAPVAGPVEDFHTEYGEKKLSVKLVDGVGQAVLHINQFGSHHTDAIISQDQAEAEVFMAQVDSAGVYHNASTRFADGYRYGFGAEVGISTAKTHARGPVGLEGLTIYKYKLYGNGQRVADYVGPQAKAFTHVPLGEEK